MTSGEVGIALLISLPLDVATSKGSDINNAIPTSPLVITPDTAFGIPWRGAMVYINDREGKITKINLTDSTVNDAELFDQTTLFRLDANTTNKRYTFFSMDASIEKNVYLLFVVLASNLNNVV